MSHLAFAGGLPTIGPGEPLWQPIAQVDTSPDPALTCLIVAGALDTGGVETVVAALAEGLPSHGIRTEVVCSEEGRVSDWLRTRGVTVTRVEGADLAAAVRARAPDVIQLHRIDPTLFESLRSSASRTVQVFHAMESYLNKSTWDALVDFERENPASIAVSASVAAFFHEKLAVPPVVVPNGVPEPMGNLAVRHEAERIRLSSAVGVEFSPDDTLVVALQRYSDQKNAAGLVDAFLLAAETNPSLRLVIAGAPSSWLEVRRADVLRRSHPLGNRVHFLGDSDSASLLLGGDLYALDSFAEGGPVSAVEAAACGLPLVLSDIGFARELVSTDGVSGRVVARANFATTQSAIALERRRRHQSNRIAFAQALLDVATIPPRRTSGSPAGFSLNSMIAGHARVLRRAAGVRSDNATDPIRDVKNI